MTIMNKVLCAWGWDGSYVLLKDLRQLKCENNVCLEHVTKIVFITVCNESQSSTKYLRLTLVFMWNSALQEKFNFCFSRVFS